MRTKPDFKPDAPKPDFTRTHNYPIPGRPNWIPLDFCGEHGCKRKSHNHWQVIASDEWPVMFQTQAEALEWMAAQEAAKAKPEPLELPPYARYSAILNDGRAVVLYSRKPPVAGQRIKQGKALEFVIEFTKKLTVNRLQLGDIPL